MSFKNFKLEEFTLETSRKEASGFIPWIPLSTSSSNPNVNSTENPKINRSHKSKSNFAFVVQDGPAIQTAAMKRLVKKHVMLDIGLARRKQTKKLRPGAALNEQNTFDVFIPNVPRFGTTRDPFLKYPIESSNRTNTLMDYLYHGCAEETESIYELHLPIGLSDPAAFHAVLALLIFHLRTKHKPNNYHLSTDYESIEITDHYTEAIKLLKDRVPIVDEATSDGTIGTIAFMLTFTNISGDHAMWHSHMKGLKQILQMRLGWGDPTKPQCLPTLTRLTLGWCDVLGCYTHDISPMLPFHEYLVPLHPNYPSITLAASLISAIISLSAIHSDLEEIVQLFTEVAKFTALLARTTPTSPIWKDHFVAGLYLQPLMYRLLSLCISAPPENEITALQEVLRLALLLYLAPAQRRFGIRIVRTEIQVGKLLALLQKQDWGSLLENCELYDVGIWIIIMGLSETDQSSSARDSYLAILRNRLGSVGVTSAAEVQERLKGMIWMDELHGSRFETMIKSI